MDWLFPAALPPLHYKFDLKGASLFRKQQNQSELAKPLPTLMERDFVAYADSNMLDVESWAFLCSEKSEGRRGEEGISGGHFPDGIRIADSNVLRKLSAVLERDTEVGAQRTFIAVSDEGI